MLNDVQALKPLFTGDLEFDILQNLPKSAYVRSKGDLYLNRFQIVWYLITFSFQVVTFLFLSTVAWMFSCLRLNSLSRRVTVLSHHIFYPMQILENQLRFGKRFIAPIINDHTTDTDLFYLEDVPRDKIKDPILREKLHPKMDRVEYKDDGLCFGAVYWFNYLYLKGCEFKTIENKYETHKEYARAIATFFENGIPKQAALLQSTYGIQEKLLDVGSVPRIVVPYEHIDAEYWVHLLGNGVYHVALPGHSISYVKFGNEQLIMDSLKGVIEIKKPKHLLEIVKEYTKSHKGHPVLFEQIYLKKTEAEKKAEPKSSLLNSFYAFLYRK